MEDCADGAALDAELVTQLVDGGAGLVALDQLLHLRAGESPGAAGLCPLGVGWGGAARSGSFRRSVSRALTWSFVFE